MFTTNDPVRSLRERHDRASAAASEAYADLQAAQKKYGDEPSSAQQRALATLQAEYDRAAGEASGAERELKAALARADSAPAGPAAGARRIGELHSYGRSDDLRAKLRADGPTAAEVVRAMATGKPVEGYGLLSSGVSGALPDYEVLGIVEQAMQESVIFSAGARVIPMDAPSVKLARITSTPEVELAPEAPDRDLTDQAIGFTPVVMDAYSAFLYLTTSLEALEDVANLQETIVGAFSRQLARAWDKYALAGDGNDAPLGLGMMFAADGISEVEGGNAAPTYAKFVEAVGRVRAKHHKPSAVVLDVPTWTALSMLIDKNDQPLQPPRAYAALAEYVSEFVPRDAYSSAIVGDFSRLLVGVRTDVQLEIDRQGAGFKRGMVAIRGYMRWGSFLDDPAAFAVVRGIQGANLAEDESPGDESPSS